MYGNEERWKAVRKRGVLRDKNGALILPLIVLKRTAVTKSDTIPGQSQTGTNAIEVDIQREIAIGKADINGVKSEEIKGKVMNKKDKLKALRRRNKK